ncbi:hypothetical protein [Streptomyces mirabilis]|uniref:hypothetical protein n=1 Tax=Streptomyces mirabilis TaxID=68239 RepID=UPI003674B2A9
MELEAIRAERHHAIDQAADAGIRRSDTSLPLSEEGLYGPSIAILEETEPWTYRWPGRGEEHFFQTRWYEVVGDRGRLCARVAWVRRAACARDHRLRAIVFHQQGRPQSNTYYPWIEFVETDDGRYAAIIPKPGRPRAQLQDGDMVPARFQHQTVERTDALFDSIAVGRSLRLVVNKSDEVDMVRHGYWAATLRNSV